jgi:hypothetical protein
VRNPLAVLASWHSLEHPLRDGHAPMAEAFDLSLNAEIVAESNALDRQLTLLNWYFESYLRNLKMERVIKYERIIESAGRALSVIVPSAMALN